MDGYPFTFTDAVRFGDLDAMRHLNNVAFLSFFETARIAWIAELVPGHDPAVPDDFGLIFAECHIAYRAPGFFGDDVVTGLRIEDVRRSSFRMGFRMETGGDSPRLIADGWGALVGYDYAAGRATQLPERLVEALRATGIHQAEEAAA